MKAAGKQAALPASEVPVFDVIPTHCTIQPGSYVFTTVTFSPVALQVRLYCISVVHNALFFLFTRATLC